MRPHLFSKEYGNIYGIHFYGKIVSRVTNVIAKINNKLWLTTTIVIFFIKT